MNENMNWLKQRYTDIHGCERTWAFKIYRANECEQNVWIMYLRT